MTNNSTYGDDLETLGKALLTDCRVAADVYALEPTCCVSWPKAKLRKFLPDGSSQPKDRNTMKALVKLVRNVFKR